MQQLIGSVKLCTYTAAIWWPKSKLCLGQNNPLWPFSCISKMVQKKNKKKTHVFFFVLSFTRSLVLYYPKLISHFHKLQNVSFQRVSRICTSLIQVLSDRQLDLGMSFQAKIGKKGRMFKRFLRNLTTKQFSCYFVTLTEHFLKFQTWLHLN